MALVVDARSPQVLEFALQWGMADPHGLVSHEAYHAAAEWYDIVLNQGYFATSICFPWKTGGIHPGVLLLASTAERIQVDTMHGVLKYKRPTDDTKVQHAGPSALRRIDLILVDEASQYDNREWELFYQQVKEQPHLPYTVVVADFKQLQPVS